MYKLIYLIGFVIRQFFLPNPFETMWPDKAVVLNWIFGIILWPVAYCLTGLIYQRGDGAVVGSILFNAIYILLTLLVWGAILLLHVILENTIVSIIIFSAIMILVFGIVLLLWLRKRKEKIEK